MVKKRRVAGRKRRNSEHAGDLHSPYGEAKKHSANGDPKRSPTIPHVVPPLSADDAASKEWLEREVGKLGAESPRASLNGQRVWIVRDGRQKLGALSYDDVASRDEAAVRGLFDLRSAVAVEFSPKALGDTAWMLWRIVDAVTHGQREVVLATMRSDHEAAGVAPATHAYRVLSAAIREWVERQRGWTPAQIEAWNGISSGIMSYTSKTASEKAMSWLARGQRDASPPWFKSRSLGIPAKDFDLKMLGRDAFLTLRLTAAREDTRRIEPIEVKVFATGSSAWANVRRIASGEYRSGAGRLVWDEEARRWSFKISYQFPRPEVKKGIGRLVVLPSLRSFVRMFTDTAKAPAPLDCGSILSFKLAIDARRAKYREHRPHVGQGARGHGKKRRFREIDALRSKDANHTETWCQQMGAHVARSAVRLGVGEVVVSDFIAQRIVLDDPRVERIVRRFPFGMLRDAILWACQKAGVPARAERVAAGCPACGESIETDAAKRWSECSSCGIEGDADFIAAWKFQRDLARSEDERQRVDESYRKSIEDLKSFLAEARVKENAQT